MIRKILFSAILMSLLIVSFTTLPAVQATNPPTLDGLIDPEYGPPVFDVPSFGEIYVFSSPTHYYFIFNMSSNRNDNVFSGTNFHGTFGWNNHNFFHLLQSDKLGVQLYDCDGTLVYDFYIDYLYDTDTSKSPNDVTRWASGVSGPDGTVTVGTPADIETYTSLEYSLENTKYNTPNLEFDFTNSDPTGSGPPPYDDWLSPHSVVSPPGGGGAWEVDFGGADAGTIDWIFPMRYEWRVPKTDFDPTCVSAIAVTEIHNSPDKDDENTTTATTLTTSIDGTTSTTITTITIQTTDTSETTETTSETTTETTSETTETRTTTTEFTETIEEFEDPLAPVGGYAMPVNKLSIMSPYLVILGMIACLLTILKVKVSRKE